MFYKNSATIVAEIYTTCVFWSKFLVSKWRTKLLLTNSHEVIFRKVQNGLKRKTFRHKAFSKRRTTKIFDSRFLELSLRKSWCKRLHI